MQPSSPLNLDQNYYTNDNLFHKSTFINVEYYFNKIYLFFKNISWSLGGGGNSGGGSTSGDVYTVTQQGVNTSFFVDNLKSILYFVIIFCMTVIAYVVIRILEVRKKEGEYLKKSQEEFAAKKAKESAAAAERASDNNGRPKNPRWEGILKHVYSENPGDWKLAIMDADEMLFALMTDMDIKGETLGEKLKSADRDKFRSLSTAWEVHTVRNRIAHEGIAFELSQREAKRVIALYEQIFNEFGYLV